ncbi:hyaluronidase-4-like isoform X2 [Protopterus annectens]|uniref:hyaluronidase-4-like isoform X2 n=1 Tax=Protopterus annectens TaxID=7888 RepID=UPI001CFB0DFA|nr:hyaluronidase-4-like isoform X2 [Protopterus annectens]
MQNKERNYIASSRMTVILTGSEIFIQGEHLNQMLACYFLLICILPVAFAIKPARMSIFQKKPFIAAWNAPTDLCTSRYNVSLPLKMFHLTGSPLATARGQRVTLFYANRLGFYPWYTEEEIPVNGGLPLNCSLEMHLNQSIKDIHKYIPSEDFNGLAVIDWEYWRPQWVRNWDKKDIYRKKSKEYISNGLKNVSASDLEKLAKVAFENSAKAFMKETVSLGIQIRPKGLWGYYLYPDCHNYKFDSTNYTGSCPEQEIIRNNELLWLWNSCTALYPSIAIKKSLKDSSNMLSFSQFRLIESMRIALMTNHEYSLPIFVYTRLGYREEPLTFMSLANCTRVKQYVTSILGHYITNVTKATEVCSHNICHSNGRCVRRNSQEPDYLHLNPESFTISRSRGDDFIVTGEPSQTDLELMATKFVCHCYQGYNGQNCQHNNEADVPLDSAFAIQHNLIACLILVYIFVVL